MKIVRICLILPHRYLGIALSLLVAMWFATGLVMMYAGGMPQIAERTRLDRLAPLDLERVTLTLAQAAERAGFDPALGWSGGTIELLSILGRPAYRFAGEATIFADTGEMFEGATLDQARAIAARFVNMPLDKVRYERTLTEADQWTLGQRGAFPQHQFAIDDGRGTEIYVDPRAGEVSMLTTRSSRTLAYLGVIPHWLYFTPLRVQQGLWYRIMVWTSAVACLIAAIGLVLALTQLRWPKPLRLKPAIPYAGLMRWHYLTGALFGITTLTFAYSGLVSLEPFAWTNARGLVVPGNVLAGRALEMDAFSRFDPQVWNGLVEDRPIKEIGFAEIQNEPYYIVRPARPASAADIPEKPLLVSARTLAPRTEPFSTDSLLARLKDALPDAPIVEAELIDRYDAYYRSRESEVPLPVLRVKFGDPMQTWIYIDPRMSRLVAEQHRLSRLERWLFSGLHDLDLPFLYDKRPLWDGVMIVLLTGGFASSAIGFYLGLKRVRRGVRRAMRAFASRRTAPAE